MDNEKELVPLTNVDLNQRGGPDSNAKIDRTDRSAPEGAQEPPPAASGEERDRPHGKRSADDPWLGGG